VIYSEGGYRTAHEIGEQAVELRTSGDYTQEQPLISSMADVVCEGLLDDAEPASVEGADLSETINFNIYSMISHMYLAISTANIVDSTSRKHYRMAIKAAERDSLLRLLSLLEI